MRRILGSVAGTGMLLAACGASTPSAPAAAVSKAEITFAYQTLFNLASQNVDAKVSVIQDGPSLRSAVAAELSTPMAKEAAGATVQSVQLYSQSGCQVELLPYPCAKVSYSILLPSLSTGNMTGLSGWAVYSGGKWLVAKLTICGLFTLANNNVKPKGC